jgi:phosphoribosylformylglycinamidine cyclo-ligase
MAKLTYKDAGVDLDLYEAAMGRLPRLLARTHSPRVLPLRDGFAGLFALDFQSPLFNRKYQDPILVACTDGVGTKLKVAVRAGRHGTIGIDLVAMCVNDALCVGAEPLFFLDYVAMSRDDPQLLEQIVHGISEGCLAADCALLGGETAIMPDVYQPGDYDLAGFCVGVVERQRIIDGQAIEPGDVLIGVASSGLHSNGYSLVRKVVFDVAGLDVNSHVPELACTVADVLLEPTCIYVRAVRSVLANYRVKSVVRGLAHITGGGIGDNLERILPAGCQAVVRLGTWEVPPVFNWLANLGSIEQQEMYRVFNMGVGLIFVVRAYYANSIVQQLRRVGYAAWQVGSIVSGERGVALA